MNTNKKQQGSGLLPREGKPAPVATFKNSLRLWQARWKAEKGLTTAQLTEGGQPHGGNAAPPA